MRNTLLISAASLALAFAVPAMAQTPNTPLPANPSNVDNGNPGAGTSAGMQPSSNAMPAAPGQNAMPAAPGQNAMPAAPGQNAMQAAPDQGAPGAPPSLQPATGMSADQSAGEASRPAKKWHRMHHAVAEGDDSGQWAHQPGTGESGPASARASNIDSADTRSAIAPHFPQPSAGESASPVGYLQDAAQALQRHRTGEAQQALEMAETRLLDRSTPATDANQTDQAPAIQQVTNARKALASGDVRGAQSAIQMALADRGQGADR